LKFYKVETVKAMIKLMKNKWAFSSSDYSDPDLHHMEETELNDKFKKKGRLNKIKPKNQETRPID